MHLGDLPAFPPLLRDGVMRMRDPAAEPFSRAAGVRRLFRLRAEPSFSDWSSVQLLAVIDRDSRTARSHVLTHRCWPFSNAIDASSAAVVARSRMIEPSVALEWQHAVEDVEIPLRFKSPLGLDGNGYEADLGNAFGSVTLRWWEDGPPEWQPWTTRAVEILREIEDLDGWQACDAGPGGRVSIVVRFETVPPTPRELYAIRGLHWRWSGRMPDEIATHVRNGELVICETEYARAGETLRRAADCDLRASLRFLD